MIKLLHEGIRYEDQVVHLTGHAYRNCYFYRCTMIVDSLDIDADHTCTADSCVWRFEGLTIHDREQLAGLQNNVLSRVFASLPQVRTQPEKPLMKAGARRMTSNPAIHVSGPDAIKVDPAPKDDEQEKPFEFDYNKDVHPEQR